MINLTAPFRGSDSFGSGEFHASRGTRIHQGIDYLAAVGSFVHAIKGGIVTKLGHTYSNDLSFRYVEIKDDNGYFIRYYYVKPEVKVGDHINPNDIIGVVQNLDNRYKGMPNHIHLEIKDPSYSNERINPQDYLEGI